LEDIKLHPRQVNRDLRDPRDVSVDPGQKLRQRET